MSDKRDLAPCLAVLGTGSDVGKSVITTALCRVFADRGWRVAPYKAQNMSNNSGVTLEGLEMGRAQIVQAEAARLAPHVDMNPILLKPTSDKGSQVVLMGKVLEDKTAREYHEQKAILESQAHSALDRLREEYDLVIMEGAGSCAEVNLMAGDIVNLRMARYAKAPVILVADIHRGGVFAQIVGTLDCISETQREMIAGFIINRFRGDLTLFEDGVTWIETKTKKPVFGVLPWYHHFLIEAEDSVVIEAPKKTSARGLHPGVAVIRTPHISNFTDFDPLSAVDGLDLCFLESVQDLSSFSAVILPGSKNTCHDLKWLHKTGWTKQIISFFDSGGHVLGICGGYQMLGKAVHDPNGIEGPKGSTPGLSILDMETVMTTPKITARTRFSWDKVKGMGYEIHMGRTAINSGERPFTVLERNGIKTRQPDGCRSSDGLVLGTYFHGFFDSPEITAKWLALIGLSGLKPSGLHGYAVRNANYDLLAGHFTSHMDMSKIMSLVGEDSR